MYGIKTDLFQNLLGHLIDHGCSSQQRYPPDAPPAKISPGCSSSKNIPLQDFNTYLFIQARCFLILQDYIGYLQTIQARKRRMLCHFCKKTTDAFANDFCKKILPQLQSLSSDLIVIARRLALPISI